MHSIAGLTARANNPLPHPFRPRNNGTERDFSRMNVGQKREKAMPFVKTTFFGTRGSQVQILPLRPSLLPFQVISIRAKRSAPLRWALFAPGVLRALRDQLRRYKLVDASLSRDRPRLPMAICFFRSVRPAGDSFQGDLSLWRSFLRSVWLAGDSFLRGPSLWCGTSILWGRFSGRISQFLGEGYWQ
jgi:hypothetical protein